MTAKACLVGEVEAEMATLPGVTEQLDNAVPVPTVAAATVGFFHEMKRMKVEKELQVSKAWMNCV